MAVNMDTRECCTVLAVKTVESVEGTNVISPIANSSAEVFPGITPSGPFRYSIQTGCPEYLFEYQKGKVLIFF